MAASAKRERQVAAFDEGELWCSDEADPPMNPAGWYFRAARGTPQLWVGPFADADSATLAPFSGDALRDAKRYLDLWRRGEPPRKAKLAIVPPAPQPAPKPEPIAESPPPPEPKPAAPPRRKAAKIVSSQQLTLDL